MKPRAYIGLSASFHDPAVAIVDSSGAVLFAEASERYLQDKRAFNAAPDHMVRMPELLAEYCDPSSELVIANTFSDRFLSGLEAATRESVESKRGGLDSHLFYEEGTWPWPTWQGMSGLLRNSLQHAGSSLRFSRDFEGRVLVRRYDHHLTHAIYACYASPFAEAVCAVIDGYGERGSTSFFRYRDGRVEPLDRSSMRFELVSLGLFYALVCGACGFDSLKGEDWKVMGLAAYGRTAPELYSMMRKLFRVHGLKLMSGVSLNERKRIIRTVRGMRRDPGASPLAAADLAHTGQQVFSDIMTELLGNFYDKGLSRNLVLTGGCALNSAFNGRIVEKTGFDALFVPSAPGDDGNAIGAALLACFEDQPALRHARREPLTPFLGTPISARGIHDLLCFNRSARLRRMEPEALIERAAELLAGGRIIGWMQGRAEFGPRALGNRSILADPRRAEMKDEINHRVKFREEYRPFAPSILHEDGPEYFDSYQFSPYMDRTLVFRPEVRAKVAAVVHEDGTGRLQSVSKDINPRYHRLISAFYRKTGVPILLNTSFNVMGKPIIHSVQDAVGMFHTSGLDALVIDDILVEKEGSAASYSGRTE